MKEINDKLAKRIDDKVSETEDFLEFLSERIPVSLEEYRNNLEKKAICERYAEKIIEAIVDLAFLVAKYLKIEISEDIKDNEIFDALAGKKIISLELCKKLQEAKGMRNIIAHEYGKISDEIVFEAVSLELEKDVRKFISGIKTKLIEEIK